MIKNFTIYGERCSGTNFLQKCFSKYTGLKETWEFGWKHFFGYNNLDIISKGEDTLFLCIVRDPYQWLMSFDRKRHHIEGGKKKQNFFTDEFYSVKKDFANNYIEIMKDRNVINGARYKNIFELRKYKSRYLWYELPLYAENNYFIRYEDLLDRPQKIMQHISDIFEINLPKNSTIEPVRKGRYYKPNDGLLNIFNQNIDWQTEKTIGYSKMDKF